MSGGGVSVWRSLCLFMCVWPAKYKYLLLTHKTWNRNRLKGEQPWRGNRKGEGGGEGGWPSENTQRHMLCSEVRTCLTRQLVTDFFFLGCGFFLFLFSLSLTKSVVNDLEESEVAGDDTVHAQLHDHRLPQRQSQFTVHLQTDLF